ncbi:MAG: hypothetical protein Kow0013_09070 [Pararhodobacter sp.]
MTAIDIAGKARRRDFYAVLDDMIERIRVNRIRNAAYRNTVRELSALSDRDLADIGLNRSEIADIARKVAAAAA